MKGENTTGKPRVVTAPVDSESLLTLVAAGDAAAFAALYDRTSPLIYGLCRRLLRNRTEAEAVTRDTFITVWVRSSLFDPTRGSAVGWIHEIAYRYAAGRLRRRGKIPTCSGDPGSC